MSGINISDIKAGAKFSYRVARFQGPDIERTGKIDSVNGKNVTFTVAANEHFGASTITEKISTFVSDLEFANGRIEG